MAKPGPIVITLKKRLGPKRLDDYEDEAAPPLPPADAEADLRGGSLPREPLAGLSRSRSRSRRRSPSPLSPLRTSGIAPSSMMNVAALEDIFKRFHGQLDTWLQAESSKLERAEARGDAARGELRECGEQVGDFLRDQAPRAFADLGSDPAGEGFAVRAVPKLLEVLDEDRRALQEAAGALAAFADRRFPKSEELAGLKEDVSPLPLLKGILRQLASQPKASSRRARQDAEEP
mmetsp:Transcript_29819/g.60124  ORF Transcript_29819/g.60124 Transcript_29819/m.60124 type:complete len:233 (-) Transcript_29819:71-769(-)